MPTSPHVDFKFKNNNVLQTTPMLGVSCVLARTTKGPYDDPSEIISTFSQFQRIYGSEIVPDGSVSNIEKALQGGSKLRVIRVLGKGATQGTVAATAGKAKTVAKSEEEGIAPASATPDPATPAALITIASGGTTYSLGLVTKGYGDPIGSTDTFQVGFYKQSNTLYYRIYSGNGQVLEQGPVVTYKTADDNNNTSVDYLALSAFAKNSEYIKPVVVAGSSFENLIKWLTDSVDGTKNAVTVTVGGAAPSDTEKLFTGTVGSAGSNPTADEWIASLDLVRDYTDFYQLFISHISQHLSSAIVSSYQPRISSTVLPRIFATCSALRSCLSASIVALTMLMGLLVPKDLVRMSATPASSSTARAAPPAITPVPSGAGSSTTLEVEK